MGSSKKEKKSKDKRKRKHKSQDRSRSRSRERKSKKDKGRHAEHEPESKRKRDNVDEERLRGYDESSVKDDRPRGYDETLVKDDRPRGYDETLVKDDRSRGYDEIRVKDDRARGYDETRVKDDRSRGYDEPRVNDDRSRGYDEPRVNDDRSIGYDETRVKDDRSRGYDEPRVKDDRSRGYDETRVKDDRPIGYDETRVKDDRSRGYDETRVKDDRSRGYDETRVKGDRSRGYDETRVKRGRSPPRRVIRRDMSPARQDEDNIKPASKSAGGDISLSIGETNKLRVKLGLKPLETPGQKDDSAKSKKKEDVHKPAINISEQKKQAALREKLLAAKQKRLINKKLGKIKTLGESDSDDDAHAWVERSRKLQQEKARAEKTAKLLQQMDEEFGIGDLVAEEFGTKKVYGSKDLKGIRVEHGQQSFSEGKSIILTLKDKGILDEEDADDTLVNVNMMDDERANINVENKKKKPDYKPYDEPEFDEYGMVKPKEILDKYDEEIHGQKKEAFQLGSGGTYDTVHERRMQEIRAELGEQGQSLKLPAPKIAIEYLTAEEMSFKKVKKRVRKIRKKNKVVTADDLLPLGEEQTDFGNRGNRIRQRYQEEGELVDDVEMKSEATIPGLDLIEPIELITDDTEAPTEDLSGVRIEEEGAALELELAIKKTRKLNTKSDRVSTLQNIAHQIEVKDEPESNSDSEQPSSSGTAQQRRGPHIVMDGTSEFCRSLGDIPTYGQAGNRAEEEEDELLDFERELQEERRRLELMEADPTAPGWQEVEVLENQTVEIGEEEQSNVMDIEPMLNAGLGGALDLAVKKGFLESEKDKGKSKKQTKTRIEADNYSIEDKRYDDLDEKYNRKRDRFGGGMVHDFTEKRYYKPEVKLEYFDEKGHSMNHKEAFRYLSHRFHGKGSGKLKTEKRKKKIDQESLMLSMTSTDTPLNTTSMLKGKLKQEKTPYLVLSGANRSGQSSLSKS